MVDLICERIAKDYYLGDTEKIGFGSMSLKSWKDLPMGLISEL
jgi:hypothetical protein